MRTLTIAALTTLHADRTAHGHGRAPSLAECLDAARAGRLYDVDTQSSGYDGLEIGDDADEVSDGGEAWRGDAEEGRGEADDVGTAAVVLPRPQP